MKRRQEMKKALVIIALLTTSGMASNPISAYSLDTTLDTRTQGASVLTQGTQVDSRGLTFQLSVDITLDTRKPRATIILVR